MVQTKVCTIDIITVFALISAYNKFMTVFIIVIIGVCMTVCIFRQFYISADNYIIIVIMR